MAITTPAEFREWLLHQFDRITYWSQPMSVADIPEGVETIKTDEEWPGPDLQTLAEDAADVVREAGEIALLLGLPELYKATRIRSPGFPRPMLNIEDAKELLGRCLAAANELIEKSANGTPAKTPVSPAAVPSQEETTKLAPVEKRTTMEKEASAIGLLVKNPDWSLKRIAERVGVSRRTLYNWRRFREACGAAKAKDTPAIPAGSKTSNGVMQAYNSPPICACGAIATQLYGDEDCCRECYLEKVQEEQEADARSSRRHR